MKPLTWKEIERISKTENEFGRTEEIFEKYRIYLDELKNKNIDISKYVRNNLFVPPEKIENISIIKPYAITLNSFPYNIESDIYNYIVWINPIISMNDDFLEQIKLSIKDVFGEYLMRQNPVHTRSVQNVIHYHVFSKTKPEDIQSHLSTLLPID